MKAPRRGDVEPGPMRIALLLYFCLANLALGQELTTFQTAAAEAGMTYKLPAGFTPVARNGFSFACRNADGSVELRYVVNSLADDVEAYRKSKEPGSQVTAVDPNIIYSSVIMVAAANISQTPPNPKGADHFPLDAVKQEFGADDGMTTAVPIADPEFSSEYKFCVICVIQKNNVGYGIIYALADDQDALRKNFLVANVFHALRFK